MKAKTTSLILLFVFNSIWSQDLKTDGNYYFKTSLLTFPSNLVQVYNKSKNTSEDVKPEMSINANSKVKIKYIKDGIVYFEYWNYPKPNNQPDFDTLAKSIIELDSITEKKIAKLLEKEIKQVKAETSNKNSDHYIYNRNFDTEEKLLFSMNEEDFESLTEVYYNIFRGVKYGGYTVPIRLRKNDGNFEFDANLSLGANIVARLGCRKMEHFYVDLSFGMGLTKINLNSENSKLGDPDGDFKSIEILSPTAFTLTGGLLINFVENVNLGVYVGVDNISSSDDKADWIHQGKAWLGLGINISLAGKVDGNKGTIGNNNDIRFK